MGTNANKREYRVTFLHRIRIHYPTSLNRPMSPRHRPSTRKPRWIDQTIPFGMAASPINNGSIKAGQQTDMQRNAPCWNSWVARVTTTSEWVPPRSSCATIRQVGRVIKPSAK